MIKKILTLGRTMLLMLSALTVSCTTQAAQPFPATALHYHAKLYELIEPDEAKYDMAFAKMFDTMLAPYARTHRGLRNRITSGPTAESNYVAAKDGGFVHFGICQAHQCDSTTMDILYSVETKKMVGKLLDRCKAEWLGNPTAEEISLLNSQHALSFPASVSNCGDAQ